MNSLLKMSSSTSCPTSPAPLCILRLALSDRSEQQGQCPCLSGLQSTSKSCDNVRCKCLSGSITLVCWESNVMKRNRKKFSHKIYRTITMKSPTCFSTTVQTSSNTSQKSALPLKTSTIFARRNYFQFWNKSTQKPQLNTWAQSAQSRWTPSGHFFPAPTAWSTDWRWSREKKWQFDEVFTHKIN